MAQGPIVEATQARHSAPFGGEPVIDTGVIDTLQEMAGEDEPEFLVEIIELFLEDSGERIEELVRVAGEGDAPAVARVAHALKSASASVGAGTLSWSCEEIEDSIREERALDLEAEAERVAGMFGEVEQVLASLKASVQAQVR